MSYRTLAPTVTGVVDPGSARVPDTVGQAHRLPIPRTDSTDHAHALQRSQRLAAQQQFQIIGVLSKLYVLMENADGLVLVDQHAAHERVLFEELRRRMEEQGVPTQKLLLPQIFDVPPRDADWIERNISILQKMGIGIESFGPGTFKIDSLPGFLNVSDPAQFMRKVIDDLKSAGNSTSPMRLGEEMIAKTVCRHAVKANDPLRYPEIEKPDSRFARLRPALLLSPWTAYHDPDFACGVREKIRTRNDLTERQVLERFRSAFRHFFDRSGRNAIVDSAGRIHCSLLAIGATPAPP